ncbi:MAG: hypothetical protein ACKVI4_09895 [Actinomycetales bacterium]
MTDSPYTPFGMTAEEAKGFHVLREDLSAGARTSLITWLSRQLTRTGQPAYAAEVLCREVQLHTDVSLGIGPGSLYDAKIVTRQLQSKSDLNLLRVTDYLLSRGKPSSSTHPVETVLAVAHSLWTVGLREGRVGLVDRVTEGVRAAAEDVATRGTAGRVLARAWANIHGFEKKASAAYGDAVRAVEIVAIECVQKNNQAATLGTVIGQMKADGDWALPLREHHEAPAPELLLAMLRTLWFGHRDRHGKADYSDVTDEETRAAVALAVTLVDWFDSGAISRRAAKPTA